MSLWAILATLYILTDTLLRAFHYTRFIMFCMLAMAVINIGATLWLLHLIGPAGAIWGTVIGTLAILVPYIIKVRQHLTRKIALASKDILT